MFEKKKAYVEAIIYDDGNVVCTIVGRGDHVAKITGEIIGNVAQTMLESGLSEQKTRSILHRLADIATTEAKKTVEERRKAGEGDDPKGAPEDTRP